LREHAFFHNQLRARRVPDAAVALIDADFARGRPAQVTNPAASPAERDLAVQRALSRVGEHRYSLTGNNCEHFANWCATGIAISQQVIAWLAALARIAFAAAATAFVIALSRVATAE
jgi:hypothetical protein